MRSSRENTPHINSSPRVSAALLDAPKQRIEVGEPALPADLVPGARLFIVEAVVHEAQLGAAGVRRQLDAHARHAVGCALESPGEHQPAVRHHLLVHASHLVHLATGALEHDAVVAAHAQVDLGGGQRGATGTEPLAQRLRVGPRTPDLVGLDAVVAADADFGRGFWLGDDFFHRLTSCW